ncbi:MAG: TRAP transporter small permease [Gammaproteobacteria bacterium]|jgi:TRAP-type C4-dicarboxylate transport system permease small subunit|nr:TRAP transporter small permease [Gammaproteobacteria bacterium]MBU0770667.1 TRAP transporter small permease [Gammaproteobacteria bacterium]MBU0857541.1 TRAP transporter small permease [Gammaproteobacteria bacterium]MBU1848715.1 TRAP transporter small permease [Gammaproteobacteria bacterium]
MLTQIAGALRRFNRLAAYLSGGVIIAASAILVWQVAVRYWLKWPTDWEIELCVMLLIISTFMSAAHTQAERGHVAIDMLDTMLSPRVNRWRLLLADTLTFAFCAFVAWNAWEFFHEAWADGKTSPSLWGPKLWIPYFFVAFGMTTLTLELALQAARHKEAA